MASVTIKVLGEEAVIEDYEWTATDPLKGLLDTYLSPHGTSPSDPFPEMTVAQDVISRLGGEVLSFDPPRYPEDGKVRIY